MTQPPEGLHRHPDREAPNQAGDSEPTSSSAELGEHIWGRYGSSPGVIPTAVTLGLTRRISRLSTGRLPLLAAVQRRWSPGNAFFPHDPATLPYVRPPAFAGISPLSAGVVQPASETPSRRFGPTSPARVSVGLARLQGTVSSPRAEGAAPAPPPGEGQSALEARAAPLTAASSGNLGTAILQRHLAGPAGRVTQRQAAPVEVTGRAGGVRMVHAQQAAPADTPREGGPEAQPAGGEIASASEARTGPGAVGSAGDLGRAIVQRHLSGPAGRALQGQAASVKVTSGASGWRAVHLERAGPKDSPDKSMPRAQPAGGEIASASEARTGPGAVGSAGDLGRAIVQRHLSGPAGQAVQLQAVSAEPMGGAGDAGTVYLQRAGPGDSPDEGVPQAQPARGVSPPAGEARAVPGAMTSAAGLGMAIVQRHLGGPAGRAAQHAGPPAAIQRQVDEAGSPVAAGGGPMVGLAADSVRTTGLDITLTSPPSEMALSVAGTCNGTPHSDGEPPGMRQDMPLLKMPERGATGAGGESTMPALAQPANLDPSMGLTVQRVPAAEGSFITPATGPSNAVSSGPAGEPSPPTTATPSMDEIDVERLADEVYMIIERRLIIERESLGLPASNLY